MMNFIYLCLILFVCSYFIKFFYNEFKYKYISTNYLNYLTIFNFYFEKCYEIVYQQRIVKRLQSKQLLTELEIQNLEIDFIRFFYSFCGQNIINSLIYFYTDRDTLTLNLQLKFQNKFLNDETYNLLLKSKDLEFSKEDVKQNG